MDKKVALITGGTKGIGLKAALKFAENNYRIAVNGRSEAAGAQAVKELNDRGFEAIFISADVGKEEDVDRMVKQVMNQFGRIDALVNNAGGLGGRSSIEEMSTPFWNDVLALNLHSTFYCTRACIPYLKQNGGSVVNVTSISAYHGGGPGAGAYSVSKAGVIAFTRASAKELISHNIRVNVVAPGVIDTEFHSSTSKELMEGWKQGIPAKRFGTAEEVANAIYFLASEEASYVIGEVMHVNGGQEFH